MVNNGKNNSLYYFELEYQMKSSGSLYFGMQEKIKDYNTYSYREATFLRIDNGEFGCLGNWK